MAGESTNMGNDLERILKRLRAGKKSLRESKRKTHKLDVSIQTQIRVREKKEQNQKRSS